MAKAHKKVSKKCPDDVGQVHKNAHCDNTDNRVETEAIANSNEVGYLEVD
jgi:hypothetical protein